MDQQAQTKQYFESHSNDWQKKIENNFAGHKASKARFRAVMDVIDRIKDIKRFLDVGCGVGALPIKVAQHGIESEGIDFSEDMIRNSKNNAASAGVSVNFICDSFFNHAFKKNHYDLISAQGFIEYVSPDETNRFFENCYNMLKPNGTLVVGSRNRLFNCFSCNKYTEMEVALGTISSLLKESVALQSHADLKLALDALEHYEQIYPQPVDHPTTAIDVDTRYQYSPGDLLYRLKKYGFRLRALYPIHYHGLPLSISAEKNDLHSELAILVERMFFRDHRLTPFSSSFVLEAYRE